MWKTNGITCIVFLSGSVVFLTVSPKATETSLQSAITRLRSGSSATYRSKRWFCLARRMILSSMSVMFSTKNTS